MGDSTEKEFRTKIIGKWIKGVFFKTPMLSIEFIDNEFAFEQKFDDIKVRMAEWNYYEIGKELLVTMYQNKDDGLWYYYPQNQLDPK